jgi:hypothetical protein
MAQRVFALLLMVLIASAGVFHAPPAAQAQTPTVEYAQVLKVYYHEVRTFDCSPELNWGCPSVTKNPEYERWGASGAIVPAGGSVIVDNERTISNEEFWPNPPDDPNCVVEGFRRTNYTVADLVIMDAQGNHVKRLYDAFTNGVTSESKGNHGNGVNGCAGTWSYSRVDASTRYELVPADSDGDGVTDDVDPCPQEYGEDGGCPPDSDSDGLNDSKDPCPLVAGSNNGCPPDSDADGYTDDVDLCPSVAGGNNGCPPDSDGDGFYDDVDQCPQEAGDDDGCPAKDKSNMKPWKETTHAFAVPISIDVPGYGQVKVGHHRLKVTFETNCRRFRNIRVQPDVYYTQQVIATASGFKLQAFQHENNPAISADGDGQIMTNTSYVNAYINIQNDIWYGGFPIPEIGIPGTPFKFGPYDVPRMKIPAGKYHVGGSVIDIKSRTDGSFFAAPGGGSQPINTLGDYCSQ